MMRTRTHVCRQVLEAKTDASSLTAKLADAEAELRAATSRVEDVSAKVCFLWSDRDCRNGTVVMLIVIGFY